jgi:response regulator of citrate/malate metabolism
MNILIIEDDIFLSQNIKKVFKKIVITNLITLISSYESFIKELPVISSYDIILVDIQLKDLHHQN